MVKGSIDQKLRLQNFDARHGEIETEAVVKSRKGSMALKGEKAFATSGKKKASVRKGGQCSFQHESDDRAPKPTPKAAPPSEPSITRGRSVPRKRSIRGKSNHGSILRQPCRYFLRGTCTRTSCEYWHPPECQFYKNESGCEAGDKCLFQHHEVDEQPNKNQKKSDHSPKKEKPTTKKQWLL